MRETQSRPRGSSRRHGSSPPKAATSRIQPPRSMPVWERLQMPIRHQRNPAYSASAGNLGSIQRHPESGSAFGSAVRNSLRSADGHIGGHAPERVARRSSNSPSENPLFAQAERVQTNTQSSHLTSPVRYSGQPSDKP